MKNSITNFFKLPISVILSIVFLVSLDIALCIAWPVVFVTFTLFILAIVATAKVAMYFTLR